MESLQALLFELFGGDLSFFNSIWDLIQGFLVIGSTIIAFVYRQKHNFSNALAQVKAGEVDKLAENLTTIKNDVVSEVDKIKETVTYIADILVTLSLTSPVLLDKAKQTIAGYAEQIKVIAGVELESITQKIIAATQVSGKSEQTLQSETAKIEQEAAAAEEAIKETEETVEEIINSITL
jgi:uncharacterized protein YukE